jgi:hypothetical protein
VIPRPPLPLLPLKAITRLTRPSTRTHQACIRSIVGEGPQSLSSNACVTNGDFKQLVRVSGHTYPDTKRAALLASMRKGWGVAGGPSLRKGGHRGWLELCGSFCSRGSLLQPHATISRTGREIPLRTMPRRPRLHFSQNFCAQDPKTRTRSISLQHNI